MHSRSAQRTQRSTIKRRRGRLTTKKGGEDNGAQGVGNGHWVVALRFPVDLKSIWGNTLLCDSDTQPFSHQLRVVLVVARPVEVERKGVMFRRTAERRRLDPRYPSNQEANTKNTFKSIQYTYGHRAFSETS